MDRAAGDRGWTSVSNGGRRRRPALPLPVHPSVEQSAAWRICDMPIGCVILEEIMQYTLSHLHIVQKSLRYWNSKARGSDSQHRYFMVFERGPRAFFEATCQSLTRLTGRGGPSPSLLDSAEDIISINIDVLTSMERCLAAFLSELYSEADICKEGLTGSRDKSLHALFIALNNVFFKLEEVLGEAADDQTLLFIHSGNPSELRFTRLPEVVGTESPQWTETLSTDGIRLIYQNLQKLDNLVSSQLSSHKKPSYMTLYWLPYTCGAIGFSACSLWLLRHSSLMGSSDLDSWIGHAKESLAGFWNVAEKPVRSVGDKSFESFKGIDRPLMDKQESRQTEKSLQRHEKEWMHQIQNLFGAMCFKIQKPEPDLLHSILELDQVVKANILDLHEAILGFSPVFEAIKLNFALLALGLPLLLLLRARARAVHVQRTEGRRRIAWRLIVAEQRLLEFQECNV